MSKIFTFDQWVLNEQHEIDVNKHRKIQDAQGKWSSHKDKIDKWKREGNPDLQSILFNNGDLNQPKPSKSISDADYKQIESFLKLD